MKNGSRKRLANLTRDWGAWNRVSLYLERCQIDTPDELVQATWSHVRALRKRIGTVVDFGAGDGRFAQHGSYKDYVGYEIDEQRSCGVMLPANATIVHKCAFSDTVTDADLCIGNPPFVRNQDLPVGWRQRAAAVLNERTGISVSGLANAWQYFFLLALTSVKRTGMVALVVPYEWVSRPSSADLRAYIRSNAWDVDVYRLVDTTFDSVLTTSSITIVNKAAKSGRWRYFKERANGEFSPLRSPSGARSGVISYTQRAHANAQDVKAKRGLSPGTQEVLTLTEGERVRHGLRVRTDVVPCVTTLRHLPSDVTTLNKEVFDRCFRRAGERCWLIRTDKKLSPELRAYLTSVPPALYQTSTCLEREDWWRFTMPEVPDILVASSFRNRFPKTIVNEISARAVGGVYGVYNNSALSPRTLSLRLRKMDIANRVVSHSNGLRKVEINQLNTLLLRASQRKQRKK
ncbi:MAG: Eco57I restriction-modification methylase domain-containing protein [Pseudomonadota bacterium]